MRVKTSKRAVSTAEKNAESPSEDQPMFLIDKGSSSSLPFFLDNVPKISEKLDELAKFSDQEESSDDETASTEKAGNSKAAKAVKKHSEKREKKDVEPKLSVSESFVKKFSAIPVSIKLRVTNSQSIHQDIAKRAMEKSVIKADFEKKQEVTPYQDSVRHQKKLRKEEASKTKGKKWFDLPATEITDEVKADLIALRLRGSVDPKRFYKKNDIEGLPKYFQLGTVVEDPVEFYSARIPMKERKKSLMEELLADAEVKRYSKKVVKTQIIRDKKRQSVMRHMRRLKKKKR